MNKIQSYIFRFLLLIIVLFLVFIQDGIFYKWVYLIFILTYSIVYIVLRKKEKDLLRLFWDFLFINAIVYGRDLSQPIVFFLILMPLINAINYTGKKRHYRILFVLTFFTITINEIASLKLYFFPIIALWGMYVIAHAAYERWKLDKEMTARIDSFFLSPEKPKSHQIYPGIIDELNKYAYFSNNNGVKQIRAYRLKDNFMWLVNASTFIWDRFDELPPSLLNVLKNNDNKCVGIEKSGNNYIYCYVPKEDIEYVFVAITNSIEHFYSKYRLFDVLPLTFNKLSLLLNTEYRLQQRRDEKFKEIKDYVLYVNKATRMMHFIRNKMTPVRNLIAFNKAKNSIPYEVQEKMKLEIDKISKVAEADLKDILLYADYLLDDTKNPYAENIVREIGVHNLYILLSELAEQYLNIVVELGEDLKQEVVNKRVVHANEFQFKILILDWIENMRKYGNDYYKVSMQLDRNQLVIHFENNSPCNSEFLNALIKNLNSKAKDAVLEGKNGGHGIFIIKSIARQFDIEVFAQTESVVDYGCILSVDFKLSTYERKENINI